MIEYVAQNQLFPTLLGAQAVDADAMYRPISFCLLQTVDGAQVAYNTLTGELLELTVDEAAALSGKEIKGSEAPRALLKNIFSCRQRTTISALRARRRRWQSCSANRGKKSSTPC